MPGVMYRRYDVLLVEDDEGVALSTMEALECFEFRVTCAGDSEACFRAVEKKQPDIILLDLELPGMRGDQICRELRDRNYRSVPIVGLSGCGDDELIVKILEAGADDFVPKSQAIPILIAHIRAVLKRGDRLVQREDPGKQLQLGSIMVDLTASRISIDGTEITMTPTEQRLLETFIRSPGTVFTRSQLIDNLHGVGYSITPRTIDVHINGLRNRLGKHKAALETVRGVGYRFVTG